MNDRTFGHHLAAWLDPYALVSAARRYDTDRHDALKSAGLLVSSGRLSSGDEANYASLVRKFLRGFRVPDQVILQLRRFDPDISDETWTWLEQLDASSEVLTYRRGAVPDSLPPTVILALRGPDAVLDVLRQPVLALLDLVGQVATHWGKLAALGANVFHTPTMPTDFYNYVDREVASAYLSLVDPAPVAGSVAIKNGYRAVTIIGEIAATNPVWEAARDAARAAASTTRTES